MVRSYSRRYYQKLASLFVALCGLSGCSLVAQTIDNEDAARNVLAQAQQEATQRDWAKVPAYKLLPESGRHSVKAHAELGITTREHLVEVHEFLTHQAAHAKQSDVRMFIDTYGTIEGTDIWIAGQQSNERLNLALRFLGPGIEKLQITRDLGIGVCNMSTPQCAANIDHTLLTQASFLDQWYDGIPGLFEAPFHFSLFVHTNDDGPARILVQITRSQHLNTESLQAVIHEYQQIADVSPDLTIREMTFRTGEGLQHLHIALPSPTWDPNVQSTVSNVVKSLRSRPYNRNRNTEPRIIKLALGDAGSSYTAYLDQCGAPSENKDEQAFRTLVEPC